MNTASWLPGWVARAGSLLTTGGPLRSRSPPGPGAPGSSCTRAQTRWGCRSTGSRARWSSAPAEKEDTQSQGFSASPGHTPLFKVFKVTVGRDKGWSTQPRDARCSLGGGANSEGDVGRSQQSQWLAVNRQVPGTFLVVQWLRLCTSTSGDTGFNSRSEN